MLLDLPYEILMLIARRLSGHDLCSLRMASLSMHRQIPHVIIFDEDSIYFEEQNDKVVLMKSTFLSDFRKCFDRSHRYPTMPKYPALTETNFQDKVDALPFIPLDISFKRHIPFQCCKEDDYELGTDVNAMKYLVSQFYWRMFRWMEKRRSSITITGLSLDGIYLNPDKLEIGENVHLLLPTYFMAVSRLTLCECRTPSWVLGGHLGSGVRHLTVSVSNFRVLCMNEALNNGIHRLTVMSPPKNTRTHLFRANHAFEILPLNNLTTIERIHSTEVNTVKPVACGGSFNNIFISVARVAPNLREINGLMIGGFSGLTPEDISLFLQDLSPKVERMQWVGKVETRHLRRIAEYGYSLQRLECPEFDQIEENTSRRGLITNVHTLCVSRVSWAEDLQYILSNFEGLRALEIRELGDNKRENRAIITAIKNTSDPVVSLLDSPKGRHCYLS